MWKSGGAGGGRGGDGRGNGVDGKPPNAPIIDKTQLLCRELI